MPSYGVVLVLCVLTPVAVSSVPRDCDDVHRLNSSARSGVYNIYPVDDDTAVQAYCDMDTDGGAWTVFQRRMDGSVGFTRLWDEYKRGFGNAGGEYWLGLENIYYLTFKRSELRVDMEDFSGNTAFAEYSNFYINSEERDYMLHFDLFKGGNAGNALGYHNGWKFSTLDRDTGYNCPGTCFGGYWYGNCAISNPNGLYMWGVYDTNAEIGVTWNEWKGNLYSLKSISMKVRPLPRREDDEQTDE